MKDCDHIKTRNGQVTKKFLGGTFKAKVAFCAACDAVLWDNALQEKYNAWLAVHHKKNRHRFNLQPSLSRRVRVCLAKMQEQFPGTTEASLIKALVILYVEVVAKDPELSAAVEQLTKSKNYQFLTEGPTKSTSVNFKPSAMVSIHAWSSLTGLAPSKVVEEALHRQLAIYLAIDEQGRRIWRTVKEWLEIILMAA